MARGIVHKLQKYLPKVKYVKCNLSYLYNQCILDKRHPVHYQTGLYIYQPQKHSESCRENVHLYHNIGLFDSYYSWLHHLLHKRYTRLLEIKRCNCVSNNHTKQVISVY